MRGRRDRDRLARGIDAASLAARIDGRKMAGEGFAERIARIERLAAEIAPLVGADVETTKRAARLAKADLLTEGVGEFPELQGLMGK